jgi:hypothetical protein
VALAALEADKTKLMDPLFYKTTLANLKVPNPDSTASTKTLGANTYEVDLVRVNVAATTALLKVRVRASWKSRTHSVVLSQFVAAPL